ncbi:MAG TPA: thioredoxin domain-containing protein [Pyrinomonadaceae bacterium]|nr:thioredoxin domain-containing protein [Pyrinomonadaceae bacterium]
MHSSKIKIILAALAAISMFLVVAGQTPRRPSTSRPAAPKPTPTAIPTPAPTATPNINPASPALAIVGDTTISASDIAPDVSAVVMRDPDPYLHDYFTDSAKAIREARERAVDARVASMLVSAEAKKRGKSPNDIIAAEIDDKAATPTEQDIRAAYEANRAQLGGADLESVRPDLINFLRNQQKATLYAALVNRLKMTNMVSKSAEVNAPNLAPGTVLVSVNGDPLRADAINERMKAYIYKMQMRVYEIQKNILDRRINDMLIVAEANKRKIGPEEIVKTEITDKIKTPTDSEVTKFYDENKANIKSDLASVRVQIVNYLQQKQQEELEVALANKLRTSGNLKIFLKEPEAPVMNISLGTGASRGDVNSPVTVVEFTDFQCSACGGMYPIVEEVLKSYGPRVHFVIRNFPLTSIHENAYNAAQAAEAAKAQGKFWEYIDVLFKNQTTLDRDSLKKYATQVGLDRKQFDADFDSGKYESVVRHDIEDGELYGIGSTPTIFINGVVLTEYSGEGLRAAIEKAFTRAGKR